LVLGLVGCAPPEEDTPEDTSLPPAGPLVAGLAEARVPAPLGIGTAGFGPFGSPSSETPFSDIYPGTQHIFGHPDVRVIALSRGEGHEAVFVRLDAVGVFAQLRSAIVDEVSARLGRDMDDAILVGATHTHSGPGRVLNTGTDQSSFFDLIVDRFHPEFYERFVDTIADTVEAAFLDARPARLGATVTTCAEGHEDRRCEDGEDYTNDTLPLLAVERDGVLDALLMAYPVHGTVLGIQELHLSQDVSGAIETAVGDRFDHPVMPVMFNAWGADMSPSDPDRDTEDAAVRDDNYDQMWRVGDAVAASVEGALDALVFDAEPVLQLRTHRAAIDREAIGYAEDEFPYEYGGVYCGTESGSCEEPAPVEGLDQVCIPFNPTFPAPTQTDLTVGQIGPFAVVTFPGEPGTRLAEHIIAGMRELDPEMGDVLFLGYTQDYLGYSLLEEDWWYGGYEASGALWGPRQGAYLSDQVVDRYGAFVGARGAVAEPSRLAPFPYTIDDPYQVDDAQGVGTIAQDVAASVAADEVVVFAVQGSDPWLGAPTAQVVDEEGVAVTRPSGRALNSDQQDFDVTLSVDPPYTSSDAPGLPRTFLWTYRLSPRGPLTRGLDLTGGTWRLRVSLPEVGGASRTVDSSAFTVGPATP
jgi:hypothetical protein